MSVRLGGAADGSGHRRLGLTRGKTHLRRVPHGRRVRWGWPRSLRGSGSAPGCAAPPVANHCERGSGRLRHVFRTDAARWPHRAGAPTRLRREIRQRPRRKRQRRRDVRAATLDRLQMSVRLGGAADGRAPAPRPTRKNAPPARASRSPRSPGLAALRRIPRTGPDARRRRRAACAAPRPACPNVRGAQRSGGAMSGRRRMRRAARRDVSSASPKTGPQAHPRAKAPFVPVDAARLPEHWRRTAPAGARCPGGNAMRPARCSPHRQFGESENRSAGAPIGGGTDSSQATGASRYRNDPRKASGSPKP